MKQFLKKLLGDFESKSEIAPAATAAHSLELAACVIFIEMASMDDDFSDVELEEITSILRNHYGLEDEEVTNLISSAEETRKSAVDMYSFTRSINDRCSKDEKLQLMEHIWQIIYADGRLDKHEDHLAHKLARLLKIEHRQMIDAKLKARSASK